MFTAALTFFGTWWCSLGELFPLFQKCDFSPVQGRSLPTLQQLATERLFRRFMVHLVKLCAEGLAHGKFWELCMDSASKHTETKHIFKRKPKEKDIDKYIMKAGKTQSSLYREQEIIIFGARNSGLWTTARSCNDCFSCFISSNRRFVGFMQVFMNSVLTLLFIKH